jgi:predicted nucleotidyltransferase
MISDPCYEFERHTDSDPVGALLARQQQSAVINALKGRPGVVKVISSGSFARGTYLGPIHDVDLIVVFDKHMHLDRRGGGSAQAALEHLEAELKQPRGPIRRTELRDHVVKCDLHRQLGPFDTFFRDAPPVDVMPAVKHGSHLRIPERHTRRWKDTDPEQLRKMVEVHQRAWSNFDGVVRMIKVWADHQNLQMKSLAVEVMVLKYLPRPGLFGTMSCSDAVARFFEAASRAHIDRLDDPTGRCGEIDSHMNYAALRKALGGGAGQAGKAIDAERAWKNRHRTHDPVVHPSVFWQEIFGKEFQRPRVWYRCPQRPGEQPSRKSRHWFDECAESGDERARIWRSWLRRPSGRQAADWWAEYHRPQLRKESRSLMGRTPPRLKASSDSLHRRYR